MRVQVHVQRRQVKFYQKMSQHFTKITKKNQITPNFTKMSQNCTQSPSEMNSNEYKPAQYRLTKTLPNQPV